MSVDLSKLADKWPSHYVARDKVSEFTGGMIKGRTLANLDARGLGPKRFYIGKRRVVYGVEDLITWLEARTSEADQFDRASGLSKKRGGENA